MHKDLRILKTNTEFDEAMAIARKDKLKIGFVPTMGALHEGHASLVKQSVNENDVTVVSIFVNPKQFNSKDDFEKYPITISGDTLILEKAGCDFLYLPGYDEVYPKDFQPVNIELGSLNLVFEGPLRPGHFDGVVQVVNRLFAIVQPNVAYFGLKDYQQCMVIKALRDQLFPKIQLVLCQTTRAQNGLALSSRNKRLSDKGLITAAYIYKSLKTVEELKKHIEPGDALKYAVHILTSHNIEVEYFSLANAETLMECKKWLRNGKNVILVAAWIEGIRLIDNIVI